jgi:glycosyltransferase involved in cell wall biosynthesis
MHAILITGRADAEKAGGWGMRIALVHSFYSSRVPSGENTVVMEQAEVLREAGHEVVVVPQSTDERLERWSYPLEAAVTVATGIGPDPLGSLREFVPDVVHVHNLFPNFGRRWLRQYTGPLVATLHNYRPICPAATLFRDGGVCTACPDSKSARPSIRHGCFHNSSIATVPIAVATRFAADPVLQRAEVLTTLSEGMSAIYASQGVPAEKLVVLDNFVQSAAAGPGGDHWLFVGRIEREKGLHALIERWPAGRRLLVAGAQDEGDPLPLHPDVELLGRISAAQVLELLRQARGLVFPSIWPEGLALACLEALAVGTPILTFDDIPAGRSVKDLGIGLAGPRSDIAALVEQAAAEFPRLREHCRAVHRRRFTPEAWLQKVEAVYERAMSASRGGSGRHPAP